jgi:NET1-associated nuclear protein 1 (U3 small nucleolar RNA-associated protein 17)
MDWTRSQGQVEVFQTSSRTAKGMIVVPNSGSTQAQDLILVAEGDKNSRLDVVAYEEATLSASKSKCLLSLKKQGEGLQFLECSHDGQVVVGALHDRIFIGSATRPAIESSEHLEWEFFSFDTPELVTSIDVRIASRDSKKSAKKREAGREKVVDVIVGGARGKIFYYGDALARCRSRANAGSEKETVEARLFHWHRRAVHAVKWSMDGMCVLLVDIVLWLIYL